MNVLTITPFGILQKLNATRGWGGCKMATAKCLWMGAVAA